MSGLTSKEIQFLYKKGRKVYTDNLIFFFLPFNDLKVSVVVSKKISKKAVIRNKIKRRLRHLARDMFKSGKFVIVARKDVSDINFENLKNDFKKFINKIS